MALSTQKYIPINVDHLYKLRGEFYSPFESLLSKLANKKGPQTFAYNKQPNKTEENSMPKVLIVGEEIPEDMIPLLLLSYLRRVALLTIIPRDIQGNQVTETGMDEAPDRPGIAKVPEPPLPPFKLYHYHLYDSHRRPIMSVCLLEYTPKDSFYCEYFRGVALCNPLDYGVLKNTTGKKLARERAIEGFKAFLNGDTILQLCQNPKAVESYTSARFNVKGEKVIRWNAPVKVNSQPCLLTEYERVLVFPPTSSEEDK